VTVSDVHWPEVFHVKDTHESPLIPVAAATSAGSRVEHHCTADRLLAPHKSCGVELPAYGRLFDTVSVCLSKGLGAPIGSLLATTAERVAAARVWRKRLGGGMRQVGILAAAGLHALDHHVERLAEDHARARVLDPDAETNFAVLEDRPGLQASLRERGLLVGNLRPGWLRAVTYLGVSDDDVEAAAQILAELRVAA